MQPGLYVGPSSSKKSHPLRSAPVSSTAKSASERLAPLYSGDIRDWHDGSGRHAGKLSRVLEEPVAKETAPILSWPGEVHDVWSGRQLISQVSAPKSPALRPEAHTWSLHRFNWAVRKLHKRIVQLGATEFYPRGEGDEQDDDGYVYL